MSAPIVWFCVNLKSGGMVVAPGGSLLRRHGSVSMEWLHRFPDLLTLSPGRPDVIFQQEAKWFDLCGDELLLYAERMLLRAGLGRYRGFLTRSRWSAYHQVVFLNVARFEAVHHWHGADPDESRGLRGFVEAIVDGNDTRTLWLKSIGHLLSVRADLGGARRVVHVLCAVAEFPCDLADLGALAAATRASAIARLMNMAIMSKMTPRTVPTILYAIRNCLQKFLGKSNSDDHGITLICSGIRRNVTLRSLAGRKAGG